MDLKPKRWLLALPSGFEAYNNHRHHEAGSAPVHTPLAAGNRTLRGQLAGCRRSEFRAASHYSSANKLCTIGKKQCFFFFFFFFFFTGVLGNIYILGNAQHPCNVLPDGSRWYIIFFVCICLLIFTVGNPEVSQLLALSIFSTLGNARSRPQNPSVLQALDWVHFTRYGWNLRVALYQLVTFVMWCRGSWFAICQW